MVASRNLGTSTLRHIVPKHADTTKKSASLKDCLQGRLKTVMHSESYPYLEAVRQGEGALVGNELVRLAEDVAALRVAEDHPRGADILEHLRRHLASEGTLGGMHRGQKNRVSCCATVKAP